MDTYRVNIEWEEDESCHLYLTHEEFGPVKVPVDPEQLYAAVRADIRPWLRERDEARFERHVGRVFACDPDESAGAYEASDPKHPDHHSVHADIWDAREGK